MADRFSFIGRLSMPKASERFSPYDERTTDSGWSRKTLRANCHTDSGNQFLQFTGMKLSNESNKLYFNGDNGERIIVPFSERNDQKWVKKVPVHQRFIVDLETDKRKRQEMSNLLRRYENPEEIPQSQIEALGFENLEELQNAHRLSQRKRREFLSQWDYIEIIKKILENPDYKDVVFKVDGKIEISHGRNGKDYLSYVPSEINVFNREVKDPAIAKVRVFFDENSLADSESGFDLNAYLEYYDNFTKKRQYSPYHIIIPVKGENEDMISKKKVAFRKMFKVDSPNEVKYLDLIVDLLNGAPRKQLTLEDLDEETRELVELGLMSEEEALKNNGESYRANEIVRSNVFKTLKNGSETGARTAGVGADQLGYYEKPNNDMLDDLPF